MCPISKCVIFGTQKSRFFMLFYVKKYMSKRGSQTKRRKNSTWKEVRMNHAMFFPLFGIENECDFMTFTPTKH